MNEEDLKKIFDLKWFHSQSKDPKDEFYYAIIHEMKDYFMIEIQYEPYKNIFILINTEVENATATLQEAEKFYKKHMKMRNFK